MLVDTNWDAGDVADAGEDGVFSGAGDEADDKDDCGDGDKAAERDEWSTLAVVEVVRGSLGYKLLVVCVIHCLSITETGQDC